MVQDVIIITGDISNPKIAARLCNFVKGSSTLLHSHILWLEANVAPIVRSQQNSWVNLYGYASKQGTPESNQILSTNRCQSVRNYVNTFANQVNFKIELAKGESESLGDEDDRDDHVGYWRSVEIFVYELQPPPRIRVPQPMPIVNVRRITHRSFFKIRTKNSGSSPDPDSSSDDFSDLVKDTQERLLDPEGAKAGDENIPARRIASFPSSFRVNRVIFNVNEEHRVISFGIISTINTNIEYQWGSPMPNIEILTTTKRSGSGVDSTSEVEFEFLPRRRAERRLFVIPPRVP